MFIKIYFNGKPLFLCDAIDQTVNAFVHHDDAVFIDELNAHTVKTMIHEMQQPHVHAGVFLHPDLDELKRAVQKKFILVQAAGGLVKNGDNKILMIFRKNHWDLPKGKLDKNERLEDCAVREVEEETGLKKVKIEVPLTITYHTYQEGTRQMLKESHWFAMTVDGEQQLTPQTEEDITDIQWLSLDNINSYLQQTFPLITDIFQSAQQKNFIAS